MVVLGHPNTVSVDRSKVSSDMGCREVLERFEISDVVYFNIG